MMGRAGLWTAGISGSVLAHAGAFALLMVVLRPDPVPDQPMPASKLDVEAYRLDRTEARQSLPEPEAARQAEGESASVSADAIPQSRAEAIEARPAESLAATEPAPEKVSAGGAPTTALEQLQPELPAITSARPEAEPLQAAEQPVALALVQATPTAALATATNIAATPASAASSPATALTAVNNAAPSLPVVLASAAPATVAPLPVASAATLRAEPAMLQQTRPVANALPDTVPSTQPAPSAVPNTTATTAAVPEAEQMKATLAFPGGDGNVDPVSLAAFQSFMQPGDIASSGDTLRDGVSALLAQVPCSRLQVAFDPDTATLQVKGHIPETGLRSPVLAALQEQMGADIKVSDNILILPRPQCGALAGIGNVGLPQSTDQITNPLLIGEDTQARVLDYVKDDRLWFDVTAPDYPAYVYVDFFDAGGNVLHLAPNDQVPLSRIDPASALRVGAREDGDPGMQIFVGPPYGQEIAVAFAASEPLYDGLRPMVEPAGPYLEWLKDRVADARAEHEDFKGEWVYFFVSTAEQ